MLSLFAFIIRELSLHKYQEEVIYAIIIIVSSSQVFAIEHTFIIRFASSVLSEYSEMRPFIITVIDNNFSFKDLQNLHIQYLPYEFFPCFLQTVNHHRQILVTFSNFMLASKLIIKFICLNYSSFRIN